VSQEINPALLTIPEELRHEKPTDPTKQAIVRLHQHDHALLKVVLKKDKMSFQKLVGFCVRAYLDADPLLLKMLKTYRELEAVPKDVREKHVLSNRERQNILDQIEKGE
jgi:arsenate reductase-like glutaredoxin family protein